MIGAGVVRLLRQDEGGRVVTNLQASRDKLAASVGLAAIGIIVAVSLYAPSALAQADSTPPALHDTTVPVLAPDGRTLTITFTEAMKETSVPVNSAFTVKATPMGGSEGTLALATSNGVTVTGSTAVLKLDPGIAHNDGSVKVSYAKPVSGASLQDVAGNELADFTDTAVTNDSVIPRVSIEAVHPDATSGVASPEFRFTRSLVSEGFLTIFSTTTQAEDYITSTPDEFAIFGGDLSRVYSGHLVYGGNTSGDVTVTLAAGSGYLPALSPNNSATVRIKAPAMGKPINVVFTDVQVAEGESANVPVDVNLPPGLADPRESYMVSLQLIDGDAEIDVDFEGSGGQDIDVEIAPTDWQNAVGGGKTYRINQQVTTIEDTVVEANETFSLELFVSSVDRAILGLPEVGEPGHRATITILDDEPLVVSSVAVMSSQSDGYYSAGDEITFTVTFNEYVTVDTTDGTPQFAFDIGGQTRMATAAASEDEMEATFTYTVTSSDGEDLDGISWTANAITFNGGSIVIPAKESPVPRTANLDHVAQSALPGHKVDTTKPTLVSARVNATTLTLEFSEELNTTAPPVTAFTGLKTPSGSSETDLIIAGVPPTLSGRTVTLTLATLSSVSATDTDVKVTYTKPASNANPIKDLRRNEADGFTNESVMTTPPVAVVVQFAQSSYTVDEGSAVAVTVQLDKDPERTVTVPIVASGRGGAGPHDYAVPSDVTFNSGETQKTITFTATQDSEDDEGEWVRLTFGMAPASVTQGSRAQTRITITDDDDPEVSVRFAVASYTADEGGSATVTVQLSAAPGRTVLVPITATEQGGATSADYSGVPASVTFGSGQTERTFTFRATQDAVDDDGEGVLLAFGTPLPPNVSAGTPDQTTVTIIDDDGPGVNISNRAVQVVQGRSATYQVWLNTQPASAVTITPSSDTVEVTLRPASLTFQPSQWNTPQTITVEAAAESAGQTATIGHTVSGYGSVTTAYDVEVTVIVAPAVIGGTGGGGGFGPAPIAPRFVDGFRTTRPLAVNAGPGDPVGDPVAATHPEDDAVTYALSGADAGRFTVDETTGQIRLRDGGTLALGQTFNVTLTATDSAGFGAIIIVTIEVGEPSHHRYDLNRNGAIERGEVLAAMQDYFRGNIAKGLVLEVIRLYFNRL